jgi:hypothetical protein
MGKFNLTGQVATLSNSEAIQSQASGAVTDAGYLGGSSWIKSQLDASKALLKGDPSDIPGYEYVNFSDAKETLLIPDGQFDYFDLTYDLTGTNIKECLVAFQFSLDPAIGSFPTGFTYKNTALNLVSGSKVENAINPATQRQAPFGLTFSSGFDNPAWIVTNDYKECGFAATIFPSAYAESGLNNGYKITGNNPPTDDSGNLWQVIPTNPSGTQLSPHTFAQYKDATDSLAGMRYMVGLYNNVSNITGATDDKFVIKSMSINITSAGVNQLVLHCRKAATNTNHVINANNKCQGISILKINY